MFVGVLKTLATSRGHEFAALMTTHHDTIHLKRRRNTLETPSKYT